MSLLDPPPLVLMAAGVVYIFSTTGLYHLNNRNRYGNIILLSGVFLGWMFCSLRQGYDAETIARRWLALIAAASLVVSSMVHGLAGSRWKERGANDQVEAGSLLEK
jgi:hypothetical protein